MDIIKATDSIVQGDKDGLVLQSVTERRLTFEEAVQQITAATGKLSEARGQVKKLEKDIENKFWEKDLKDLRQMVDGLNSYINTLNEGIKPYVERLIDEGRKKIAHHKAKEAYDRIPKDSPKRHTIRNAILTKVMQELGLQDVAHPAMVALRYEYFDKEAKK